jgi:hypothetical protein
VELPLSGNDFLNFAFRLFHSDCFDRAGVNTNAAIDASVNINYCLIINHLYRITRALWYTRFTTGAFFLIYFSRHLHNPFKKNELKPISKRRNVTKLCSYYNINFCKSRDCPGFWGKNEDLGPLFSAKRAPLGDDIVLRGISSR